MDRAALLQRLQRTRSRGQVKALGAAAEREPMLRQALLALAEERGIDEAAALPGKALVRRLLQREEAARVRSNPIHRDEAFTCAFCGASVDRGGPTVRDHCPRCLRSLHVDEVPGDRAADCGGVLQPQALSLEGGRVVILYRCDRCGHDHRVRAHPDDQVPPSLSVADLPGEDSARSQGRARTLPRRALEAVRRQGLWTSGQQVLVAVSGGLDSTVLLELLWRTQAAHGARLTVMSLDHGLRQEAGQEVAAVMAHCQRLGVPFRTANLGLTAGPGLQARARAARRAALLSVGADRIATAHHLDDQAETVLQRLVAGGGSQGLAAMRPLDPPWCRPLLGEPRAVLQAWAVDEGLSWIEDPSNVDSQRGRIRTLLGSLQGLREGALLGLGRSAALLGRDDACLTELLDGAWPRLQRGEGLDLACLATLHPALQARAVRRLCAQAGVVPRADLVERVLRGDLVEGWTGQLSGGRQLVVRDGQLRASG